jgi:hypothetical protein
VRRRFRSTRRAEQGASVPGHSVSGAGEKGEHDQPLIRSAGSVEKPPAAAPTKGGKGRAGPVTPPAWSEVGQIAAAVTAVVGVVTGLAVTGVLQKMERNHGTLFLLAVALVLAGAAAWLLPLVAPAWDRRIHWRKRRGARRALLLLAWLLVAGVLRGARLLAVLAFAAGVGCAVAAIVRAQADTERPAISANYDPKTGLLEATVAGSDLTANDRMVILVDGLSIDQTQAPKPASSQTGREQTVLIPSNLYTAFVGPDTSGNVSQAIHLAVPRRYDAVGLTAWTKGEQHCSYRQEVDQYLNDRGRAADQHTRPGCVVIYLPDSPDRPRLTLLPAPENADPSAVTVKLAAESARQPASYTLIAKLARRRLILTASEIDPAADASIDQSTTIRLPKGVISVCAAAAFGTLQLPAPGRCGQATEKRAVARLLIAHTGP